MNTGHLKAVAAPDRAPGAVEKAVLILRFLGELGVPCTLTELTKAAGLAKTTVHRLLRTLEAAGVVRRAAGGFELCDRDLAPGLARAEHARLRRHALKAMLFLRESTHLLVQLMVLGDGEVSCVDQFEPPGHDWLSRPVDLDRRWPALQTAPGRVLLAARQADTSGGPVPPRLAYDDGVTHPGLVTAAVLVVAEEGLHAAVSVSGPQPAVSRPEVRATMISIGRRGGFTAESRVG